MKSKQNIFAFIISILVPWSTKWLEIIPNKFFLYIAIFLLILGILLFLKHNVQSLSIISSGIISLAIFLLYRPIISDNNSIKETNDIFFSHQENILSLSNCNNADSLYAIGLYFINMDNISHIDITDTYNANYPLAAKFFTLAANNGSSMAHVALAKMKYDGLGYPQSRNDALNEIYNAIRKDQFNGYAYSLLREFNFSEFENPEIFKKLIDWEDFIRYGHITIRNNLNNLLNVNSFFSQNDELIEYIKLNYSYINLLSENDTRITKVLFLYNIVTGDISNAKLLANRLLKIHPDLYYSVNHFSLFEYHPEYRIILSENQTDIDELLPKSLNSTIDALLDDKDYLHLDPFYIYSIKLEQLHRTGSSENMAMILKTKVENLTKDFLISLKTKSQIQDLEEYPTVEIKLELNKNSWTIENYKDSLVI